MTKIALDEKSLEDFGTKMLNSVNADDSAAAVEEFENITQFCVKMITFLIINATGDKDKAADMIDNVINYMMDILALNYNAIIEKGNKH